MSSLATCIKKAGKALSKNDVEAIREISKDLVGGGVSQAQANMQAVDEHIENLTQERSELVTRIEAEGGLVNNQARFSEYSLNPVSDQQALFNEQTTLFDNTTQTEDQTQTPEFKNWAGKNFEMVDSSDINDQDFSQEKPYVLKVFHGTTHEFTIFKGEEKGSKEGHFGATNYFTSDKGDAHSNYVGEGPDLTGRIERRAEELAQDIAEENNSEIDDVMDVALEKAREELSGGSDRIIEAFVRTEKPFVAGNKGVFTEFTDFEGANTEATEQIADENSMTVDELQENIEEYEEQIDERRWEILSDTESDLTNAIQSIASTYDFDPAMLHEAVMEFTIEGGLSDDMESRLRDAAEKTYIEDNETGQLIGSHVVAQIIKKLGFDSIILKNANKRFSNMGMGGNTAHVHVFDQNQSNIKSATDNTGAFDPNNPDIRYSLEDRTRSRVQDEFLEEMVDKHSDHPISQLTKLGAVVEEANQQSTASVSSIRRMVDVFKETTIGAALAASPQSKLNEYIRNAMGSVNEYVKIMKRMDGYINERLEEQVRTGRAWRKLFRSNPTEAALMGDIMHNATNARTDPSKPFVLPKSFDTMSVKGKRIWMKRKLDHAILKEHWDKLSPTTQELYQKVKKHYSDLRDNTMKELKKALEKSGASEVEKAKLIKALREKFEKGTIDPYFPLSRFGKHWATAIDPDTKEIVGFIKRESRSERNAWVKEMRKMGYDAYASEEKGSTLENVRRMDPKFVARVVSMTDKLGAEGTALASEIWQMYLRTLPEMSAEKSFISRKGRLGYANDALRAYGHHMFHGTHQLGKLRYGYQLQDQLTNIDKEAKELTGRADHIKNALENTSKAEVHASLLSEYPRYKTLFERYTGSETERTDKALKKFIREAEVDAPWARPLSDEMEQRHAYNMNPASATWATNLTALGFFWFLSTSPAAGLLNLTQTAILGMPVLGARFNSMSGATKHLLKASYQLMSTRGDMVNTLRDEERLAFLEFERIGLYTKTQTRDLTGFAEKGQDFNSNKQIAIDVAGWIFHVTEKWNREVTALAAYRMSREAGRDHKAAILETEELVEDAHFDYTNTNRPRLMQGDTARVALLFRNYSVNMSYRLVRDFRDGVTRNKQVDVEIRNEATKRLTGLLGMTFMFAGLSGMPLVWAYHSMVNALLGDEDEPYDSKASLRAHIAQVHGEKAATFITHGAWDTLTGTTLSNRASLNNLWIREVPQRLKGKEKAQHLLVEAMGPMAGVFVNVAGGINNVAEGHTGRGIEKMVPKFISDMLKSVRFATEGAQNFDGDMILSPEEFTKMNLFTQAIGFTPEPLTTQYERQQAIKDEASKLNNRKTTLMNRLYLSLKMGDKAETKETIAAIHKFNKANPKLAIDAKGVQRSVNTRRKTDERTINGVAVSKKLHYLHEKYRMTNKEKEKKEK